VKELPSPLGILGEDDRVCSGDHAVIVALALRAGAGWGEPETAANRGIRQDP
jgi:hypothetical protein